MSVWFKYAGDKDISAGRSGGASIFSLPGPVSFPPAGTILSTVSQTEYPLSEGGSGVTPSSTTYPNQVCDVYIKADGVGGSYYDWANVFNVAYKANGVSFLYESGNTSVDINGTYYPNGSYYNEYFHDGTGGYYSSGGSSYNSNGTLIYNNGSSGSNYISTPVGSYAYESWTSISYYNDGSGGYYSNYEGYSSQSSGAYIGNDGMAASNQAEVPSGSGNYFTYSGYSSLDFYYNGSGGYYSSQVSPYAASYGDFITYDGMYNYYWDGNGGYYY